MNKKPASKPPLLAPPDVVLAIYGTWLSVLLSTGFAVHEFAASTSILDPFVRILVFAGIVTASYALRTKHLWARYVLMLLMVCFYFLLAYDADGLSKSDLWHMLVKAPLDMYVLSRLFKPTVSIWLQH